MVNLPKTFPGHVTALVRVERVATPSSLTRSGVL